MPSPEKLKPPPSPTSAISFSVASLQQYTDSFSEENFIIKDKLGKTYRAEEIPDGKVLTFTPASFISCLRHNFTP